MIRFLSVLRANQLPTLYFLALVGRDRVGGRYPRGPELVGWRAIAQAKHGRVLRENCIAVVASSSLAGGVASNCVWRVVVVGGAIYSGGDWASALVFSWCFDPG